MSIDAFVPQNFRMSTLFGYKSKILKECMYEVFEPVADARFLLAIAFKRAFMAIGKNGALAQQKGMKPQQMNLNERR